MVRKSADTNIKSITPDEDEEGSVKSLTSDLPMRGRGRTTKSGRGLKGRVMPLAIILMAGVVGFMIPTVEHVTAQKSLRSVSYGQEITPEATVNEEPVAETIEAATKEEPLVDAEYATVNPNDLNYLNVRAEASSASDKLGQLDIGDKLKVVAKDGEWVKLELKSPLKGQAEGWVAAAYISLSTEKE